jgi:flagellin-specific chaperone FliS
MLVNGALKCIEAARTCIAQGHDPRRHLRAAALRIRELPATLTPTSGDPMAAQLSDLCDYICGKLQAVGDEEGLPSLDEGCDLLREICRAWVTLPAPRVTLSTAQRLAVQLEAALVRCPKGK